jgi:spore coat protein U-like protein
MKRIMILVLFLAFAGAGAFALSTAGTMTVLAVYAPVVQVSAGTLSFGDFYPGGPDITATSAISVYAPAGQPYAVSLDGGSHWTGSWRNLDGAGNELPYRLYQGSDTSGPEWGDGIFAPTLPVASAPGGWTDYPVTGHLYVGYAQPGWPAGSYVDYVTVTVTY